MSFLARAFFAITSLVLMGAGAALLVYAVVTVVSAVLSGQPVGATILDSLSYIILALAVFDVAKYLFEEEVQRGREMRQAAETRRSLTKFITTILIAFLLEGLVNTAKVSEEEMQLLLYPATIILSSVALLIGFAIFQRLSASVEEKVGAADEADEAREAAAEAGSEADDARGSARFADKRAEDAEEAADEAKAASG